MSSWVAHGCPTTIVLSYMSTISSSFPANCSGPLTIAGPETDALHNVYPNHKALSRLCRLHKTYCLSQIITAVGTLKGVGEDSKEHLNVLLSLLSTMIFNQWAMVHWCSSNGLQECCRNFGSDHLLVEILGNVNLPWCALSIIKKVVVSWQFFAHCECVVRWKRLRWKGAYLLHSTLHVLWSW